MVNDEIIIVGLPSEGLQELTNGLDIRHAEDAAVVRAYDNLNKPDDSTPEWMIGRLVENFHGDEQRNALIVYQSPWSFLERQIRITAPVLDTQEKSAGFARNALKFWHTYHLSLLKFYRQHEGRSLLINGDRLVQINAVAPVLEAKFGIPLCVQKDPPRKDKFDAEGNLHGAWRPIAEVLSPESRDLYVELESCAELTGCRPELESTEVINRETYLVEMLEVVVGQDRLDSVLRRHGYSSDDVASRLEAILCTRRELEDLATTRLRQISALEEQHATQQMEAERDLLQVRELEGEAKSREELLKKEKELLLLQLRQIREELEHYFRLHRQKDQQLA